ncbi:hypothetical protein ACI2LM_15860 [Paenibacillus lautus]|uniref:DUF7210 family protein n=1 Tax=Paenibacillus lautus TaxID=1401 RepID=UPI00384E5306
MEIKAIGKVRHNGEDYNSGDVISGLTEKEYARLIQLKSGEAVEQLSNERIGSLQENNDFSGFQLNGPVVVSVEDFSGLKADEQKAHLKALKIEPAGKEEERIAQYEEWYAEQVSAGGND